MRFFGPTASFVALISGLLTASSAFGQVLVFDDGQSHTFDTTADDVELSGPGTHLDITTGAFTLDFRARDTTTVRMVDGYLQRGAVEDSARFELLGGHVEGDFAAVGDASVLIAGGLTGWTDLFELYENARIEVTGGDITNKLVLNGQAHGDLYAGNISRLDLRGSSSTDMPGGMGSLTIPGNLALFDEATLNISEATLGTIIATDSTSVTAWGGSWDRIFARDDSTIELFGTSFAVDGVPVPDGPLTALTGTLTAELWLGGGGDTMFFQGGGANTGTIILTTVPEPGTALLVGIGLWLGALGVSSRKR